MILDCVYEDYQTVFEYFRSDRFGWENRRDKLFRTTTYNIYNENIQTETNLRLADSIVLPGLMSKNTNFPYLMAKHGYIELMVSNNGKLYRYYFKYDINVDNLSFREDEVRDLEDDEPNNRVWFMKIIKPIRMQI